MEKEIKDTVWNIIYEEWNYDLNDMEAQKTDYFFISFDEPITNKEVFKEIEKQVEKLKERKDVIDAKIVDTDVELCDGEFEILLDVEIDDQSSFVPSGETYLLQLIMKVIPEIETITPAPYGIDIENLFK